MNAEWLVAAVGAKLNSVTALVHEPADDAGSSETQKLIIEFTPPCTAGSFYCSKDGAGVEISAASDGPAAVEMNDMGRIVLRSCSEDALWRDLVGVRLKEVRELWSEVQASRIGFRLKFFSEVDIFVANLGDQLYVKSKLDLAVWDSEKLEERPIRF